MPQRSVATNFTFEQQRQEINLLAADFWTQKGTVDTAASTYLKHDGSNNFTGANLAVPNAFTINANSGSGTVTISGNLDVTGTTTTVSSANLEVTDKNILIAKGSTSDAQADGAGNTIDSATDITFNFVDNKDALVSSIGLEGTTFLKAPYGQFTGSGTATGGQGVEINAPDTNTGQIISYDRANTAYKELRVKGSSVGIYGGTSNSLVGTFNSTGVDITGALTVTGNISNSAGQITCGVHGTSGIQIINDGTFGTLHNVDLVLRTNSAARAKLDKSTGDFTLTNTNAKFISESSSSTKYVRLYAASGTGQWDIYGNGANLRFSDNASSGSVVFDRNVDANGGLDTTNITATGDINLVDNGTLYGGSGAANVLKLTSCSGNVNHSRIEVGTSEASDNGGIHFYTAGSSNATRRITIKGTSGNVGIGEDSPVDRLVVQEAKPSADVGIRVKNDTTTDGDDTNPTTASLYLNTSTGDFNTFYIQARRNDNDTHFGYADPRATNHSPTMCLTDSGVALFGGLTIQETTVDSSKLAVQGGDSNIGIIQVHSGGGENAGDLAGITFSHGADGATARAKCAIASRCIGAYGKGHLCFYVDGANDNGQVSDADEKLRISTDGSVTKPSNALIKTSKNNNYGAVGSLTTNTANCGILTSSAAINKGNTGWTETGSNAYTFVCPVDGVYVVHAHVSYGNGISGRQIWVMSYTLGGGNLPLSSYVEIIDHTAVSYGDFSYYDTYTFTAGTRIGMGKNGGSGTLTGQSMSWGIHLLQ